MKGVFEQTPQKCGHEGDLKRVQDSSCFVFRVSDLGCRGLGFKFGFRVSGLGVRVQGAAPRLGFGFPV